MMNRRNRDRSRVQVKIRSQQFFNRTEYRNRILCRCLGRPCTIRLNGYDKGYALARRLQFAIDTKMIAAERAGAHNRYAQLAFACDLLGPFALNRFQTAAIELKQLVHVVFRLRACCPAESG